MRVRRARLTRVEREEVGIMGAMGAAIWITLFNECVNQVYGSRKYVI